MYNKGERLVEPRDRPCGGSMNLKRTQTQALSSAYLQEQVTLTQFLGLAKFGPQGTLIG